MLIDAYLILLNKILYLNVNIIWLWSIHV